eukprot:sb/3465471/
MTMYPILKKLVVLVYASFVIVVLVELRELNRSRLTESLEEKDHPAAALVNEGEGREEDHSSSGALYFETYAGYRARLQIQESIQYGAELKKIHDSAFNAREGYYESYLDSLPIIRDDIKDFGMKGCKDIAYKKSPLKVSVIMNYHNELLSLLLRSIYTVLRSIPPDNFHEMILIDDASNLTAHSPSLIQVVLVLDSHVEVKPGFLEPLLEVVERNYKNIAAPVFDFWDTFKDSYWTYDGNTLQFDYYLTWMFGNVKRSTTPYRTAAILGGAFLATKQFLVEVDYFGSGMEGWGSENIEIGLKSWYCGGEVLYVPCSRVLHYTARRQPIMHGDRKKPRNLNLNTGIVAKTYFTEEMYWDINKLYLFDGDIQEKMGSINATKARLRELQCDKDFT